MSKQSALAKVQHLYWIQTELIRFLKGKSDQDAGDVRKLLKEFRAMLKEVDPEYMGGEDVLEDMEELPKEVNQKLKKK